MASPLKNDTVPKNAAPVAQRSTLSPMLPGYSLQTPAQRRCTNGAPLGDPKKPR